MAAGNAIVTILPGLVVAAAAIVVLLVDLFVARKELLAWVAAAGLVAGAAAAIGQWAQWKGGWALWRVFGSALTFGHRKPELGFSGMVSLDKYALYCVVLFAGVGIVTIMLSDAYLARRHAARGEFYGLLLLVITGMIGMVISNDIIAFFVRSSLCRCPPTCWPATSGATSAPARRRSSTSSTAPSRRPSWPSAWRWCTAPRGRPTTTPSSRAWAALAAAPAACSSWPSC